MLYTNKYYGPAPSEQRALENRYPYTALAGQTEFEAEYTIGYVDVYYNGAHLDPRTAFTATDGHTVILTDPAVAGASVVIVARTQIPSYDVYSKAQSDRLASNFYGVATGTGDAMVVETDPLFDSYYDGMHVRVRAVGANTIPTPTLSCNGLPAKQIMRNPQLTLLAGDYSTNDELIFRYVSSIDKFVLLNPKVLPATETVAGVMEIATKAEAEALTNDSVAITPKKLGDAMAVNVPPSLGVGQTWQSMMGSRAGGVTYTNTTGRTIAVGVTYVSHFGVVVTGRVNGLVVTGSTGHNDYQMPAGFLFVVPPGATYSISSAPYILGSWAELR